MGKVSRRKRRDRSEGQLVFWHGGRGGLTVGDTLKPGKYFDDAFGHWRSLLPQDKDADSPEWVFITTDRELAYDFAREVERKLPGSTGSVYRVAPSGALNADPDFQGHVGLSYRCRRAQIVAVEQTGVLESDPLGSGHTYQTWDDGSRMYTDAGTAEPNRRSKALGFTSQDYLHLGIRPHWTEVNQASIQLVRERFPGAPDLELRAIATANGYVDVV